MDVLVLKEKLDINLNTTIKDVKDFLTKNNYEVTSAQLYFADNTQLSPIVFQTNQYDNVTFLSHANALNGSRIIVKENIPLPNLPKLKIPLLVNNKLIFKAKIYIPPDEMPPATLDELWNDEHLISAWTDAVYLILKSNKINDLKDYDMDMESNITDNIVTIYVENKNNIKGINNPIVPKYRIDLGPWSWFDDDGEEYEYQIFLDPI